MKLMEAALPGQAWAKPARAHKILVMDFCGGFIHTPIPLTNKMIEEFGTKNKLWTTTVSWDPADINAVTVTPDGMVIGFFPTLDILVNLCQYLAADVFGPSAFAAHQTLRRRNDIHAIPAEHPGDLARADIHTAAWSRNTG